MGRKRKSENEKKVAFNLSITKEIIDKIKESEEYPSALIESLLVKYLKEKEEKDRS